MDARQFAILNALVTFAAENVPGGLTPEEQEVARIVGFAAQEMANQGVANVTNINATRLGLRGRVDPSR